MKSPFKPYTGDPQTDAAREQTGNPARRLIVVERRSNRDLSFRCIVEACSGAGTFILKVPMHDSDHHTYLCLAHVLELRRAAHDAIPSDYLSQMEAPRDESADVLCCDYKDCSHGCSDYDRCSACVGRGDCGSGEQLVPAPVHEEVTR